MIYLDNAATTKPCDFAVKMITTALTENFGNPSSLHALGVKAEEMVTKARKTIAASIVADPECIYFTSGATEANNLAIMGIAENYGKRRRKIISTSIEHPSVAHVLDRLEKMGFEVVRVKPDITGAVLYEDIISAVDDNTCLVTCMMVNNETGAIVPVKKAFTYIKRSFPEVITHCDAVQGYMKLPIKTTQLFADLITMSAHKVYGPKGVGAIYIKKGIRVAPQMLGGGQEKKLRSGTESVPLIAGFGAAVEQKASTVSLRYDNAVKLKNYLLRSLETLDDVTVISDSEASPYIVSLAVEGIKSEIMLHFLESKEIYVSSGSACSKGAKSSVLKEFNVNERLLDSVIRISFSDTTTREDIDALIVAIAQGQQNLLKIK